MATTVKATLAFTCTAIETLDAVANPGIAQRSVTHSAFNVKRTFDGNTTPAVSVVSGFKIGRASGRERVSDPV